jgi:hypothetical protein
VNYEIEHNLARPQEGVVVKGEVLARLVTHGVLELSLEPYIKLLIFSWFVVYSTYRFAPGKSDQPTTQTLTLFIHAAGSIVLYSHAEEEARQGKKLKRITIIVRYPP